MSRPMAVPSRRHWADIHESTCVAGIRLMLALFRILGRGPLRAMLYPVVLWYMIARPQARAASTDYLRRMSRYAGTVKPGPITVLRHFASFAETILDKILVWSGLYGTEQVQFFGQKLLLDQIAAGRGALLICCHLGNLELGRLLSRRMPGLKLTVLIHTKHAERFNRLLARLDPESQLDVIQVSELSPATAMSLAEKVARGEFVAIAGDRVPVSATPRVAPAQFLGDRAPFPAGPFILAGLLGCPTYLMFCLSLGPRSEIYFERFRETIRLPRRGRDQALAGLASDYAARLEHFCRRAPLQWFNFYDFWALTGGDTRDAAS